MKDLKQFIGKYPVSKTLRFELRPVGRTQEWIRSELGCKTILNFYYCSQSMAWQKKIRRT